ncbi:NAD(P)/FAD-dependent oxidoreductase [Nocardioides speluncae]|uniref:NAD(P)/FAD-dependent oxidoreductase n=1 Tax=Nocardioides speluncae TaxID=2670337 RepID=UPI000D6863B7|nr:FAD-dependent oxidoreductase [Nocardioides speluncae]
MASTRFDYAVIGAGVVGASVARDLARGGARVVVLDQAPGIGGGCSYANAAILAPDHVTPLATPALLSEAPVQMMRRPPAVRVRPARGLAAWLGGLTASAAPGRARVAQERLRELAHESTRLHRDLAAQGLSPTLRKTGAIDVYLRLPRRAAGLIDPERLRELEPGLAEVAGGTHHDEEWTLESRSYVTATLDDAISHGAELRFGTSVSSLRPAGRGVELVTPAETVSADHVVLAAGLGSAALAAQVGLHLPLRGGRGYVVDVAVGDSAAVPRLPVRIKEHRIVVTPLADRVRVCGSIEFGDETRPAQLSRADALLEVAAKVLPGLAGQPVIDRWAGDRPCTSDGVPIVGTSKRVPAVSVATGHGMWGLILAPASARLITQAQTQPWLSPDRFTVGASGPGSGSRGPTRRRTGSSRR